MRDTASTTSIRPGTALVRGRYRLGRLLGRGGMADVYLAHDERDGGDVAVKIVRSADPRLARRLAQEARALEQLDHPNLVRLLGSEVADGEAHLVMELVEGPTLAQRLHEGPLDAATTASLGAEVAEALAYVHGRGIVHRDVKPANILLGAGGHARLADFGIAQLVDATALTMDQTTVGTAAYMAPEQLEDHQVEPPADVWSLGVVLLECLTGRRVYEGSAAEIVARRLATPVPPLGQLRPAWRLVLSGMLEQRPDRRLPARQVAALLRAPAVAEAAFADDDAPTEPGAATVPIDLLARQKAAWRAEGGAPAAAAAGAAPGPKRRRGLWLLLAALGVGLLALILALTSGGGMPARSGTLPQRPTTTSVHPVKPVPVTPADMRFALVKAVTAGMSNGSIDSADGQAIIAAAYRAVADKADGNSAAAALDLQQAASALAAGQQSGAISLDAAITVQTHLQRLAQVLGLPGQAYPTTTTTTTTTTTVPPAPPPKPPKHHHHDGGDGGDGG